MANSSSRSNYHVRSVSLPCRSHPSTLDVEEQLKKFKTWESPSTVPTVDRICCGLSQLEDLYRSVDDLLALPLTQQALSHLQNEKWVDELLDGSVRLLDVCGRTRDAMSQIKENVADLQSALRRRKGDLRVETSIAKYTYLRKKMKKDAKRLIAELKAVDNKIGGSVPLLDLDHQVLSVIRVLREVSSFTISIFQSLLMFMAVPVSKPRPSKWLVVSKLMQKGTSATADEKIQNANELESRLEALDASVKVFDSGLESVFRRLIAMRSSLLNIVSY